MATRNVRGVIYDGLTKAFGAVGNHSPVMPSDVDAITSLLNSGAYGASENPECQTMVFGAIVAITRNADTDEAWEATERIVEVHGRSMV